MHLFNYSHTRDLANNGYSNRPGMDGTLIDIQESRLATVEVTSANWDLRTSIEELVASHCGGKSGRPPVGFGPKGCLAVFACESPFPKLATRSFILLQDAASGRAETYRSDIAADGTFNYSSYGWQLDLVAIKRGELPVLTKSSAKALIEKIDAFIVSRGGHVPKEWPTKPRQEIVNGGRSLGDSCLT